MSIFSKNKCPICNCETTFSNKSGLKFNNIHLCMKCATSLGKQGVNLFNIRNFDLDELKEKVFKQQGKINKMLECPNCKSHDIQLLANDKNYKTKYKTTLNLNPLKIFTLTNTKKITKEISKEHNEYFCKNCGNRWIGE